MMFMSPWGKLLRARDLIGDLIKISQDYYASEPYDYVQVSNDGDYDDPQVKIQWRLKVSHPYPQESSWILGDIVNNMRSSLDHSIAEVARQKFEFDEDGISGSKKLQFPIADTVGKFPRAQLRHWFPDDVIETLESHQPYREDDPVLSPIRILRELSNMDKHRALMISDRSLVDFKFSADPEPEGVQVKTHSIRMVEGAAVATVKFKRSNKPSDMVLMPEFYHIESIRGPALDSWFPLALTIELMFEAAFGAVWDLTHEFMGDEDHAWAQAFLSTREERLEKVRNASGLELLTGSGNDEDVARHK